jgi:hypothetical protein
MQRSPARVVRAGAGAVAAIVIPTGGFDQDQDQEQAGEQVRWIVNLETFETSIPTAASAAFRLLTAAVVCPEMPSGNFSSGAIHRRFGLLLSVSCPSFVTGGGLDWCPGRGAG